MSPLFSFRNQMNVAIAVLPPAVAMDALISIVDTFVNAFAVAVVGVMVCAAIEIVEGIFGGHRIVPIIGTCTRILYLDTSATASDSARR